MERHRLKTKDLPNLLADAIKDEVKRGEISDTLPGYRHLMQHFNVSQATVKSALRILEEQEVISPAKPGKSRQILTSAPLEKRTLRKLLILRANRFISQEDFIHSVLTPSNEWKQREGEVQEHLIDLNLKDTAKAFKSLVEKYKPDAILSFVLPLRWNALLETSKIPTYYIGGNFPDHDGPISACGYSQKQAAKFAVQKLREKGHIAILYPIHPTLHIFREYIKKSYEEILPELNAVQIDALLPRLEENQPDVWQSFLKLHFYQTKPTAIIVYDLDQLNSVYNFCAINNISIPNDLSVVCESSNPHIEWMLPTPSRMIYPFERQRKHFIKWVKSGCTRKHTSMLPMDWLEGQSVKSLKQKS